MSGEQPVTAEPFYVICAAEAPLNGRGGDGLRAVLHALMAHVRKILADHPEAQPLGSPVVTHIPGPLGHPQIVAMQAVYRPAQTE